MSRVGRSVEPISRTLVRNVRDITILMVARFAGDKR
jgi:hypothetical protein